MIHHVQRPPSLRLGHRVDQLAVTKTIPRSSIQLNRREQCCRPG